MSARLEDTRYARYDGDAPGAVVRRHLARPLERVRRARRAQELAREVPAGDADADRVLPAFAVLAIRAIVGQDFADDFPS